MLREVYRRCRQALRDGGVLMDEHEGGCVLYEKRAEVEALLAGERK